VYNAYRKIEWGASCHAKIRHGYESPGTTPGRPALPEGAGEPYAAQTPMLKMPVPRSQTEAY